MAKGFCTTKIFSQVFLVILMIMISSAGKCRSPCAPGCSNAMGAVADPNYPYHAQANVVTPGVINKNGCN
ncbi:hypothetical protein MKW92_022089 [Papaver armeniacum]|nr:hypothetical protein MKW92_022089 [Papaver armeniacum]